MVMTSGLVVEGKIVIDGDPLPEGTRVTVLTREIDETFVCVRSGRSRIDRRNGDRR